MTNALYNRLPGTTLRKLLWMNAAAAREALKAYTAGPAAVATFETNVEKPLKKCEFAFSPVQSGSGDPSPNNVRPITGWTGVTGYRTGKNLFDKSSCVFSEGTTIRGNDGTETSSSSSHYTVTPIPVCPLEKYYVSGTIEGNANPRIYYLDRSKNWISRSDFLNGGRTITIPQNCYYIQIQCGTDITAANVDWMIELGETGSTFESYTGTAIPVTFPAEAGTVYGGTVDVVSGVLTVTDACVTPKASGSFSIQTDYAVQWDYTKLNYSSSNTSRCLCSHNKNVDYMFSKSVFITTGGGLCVGDLFLQAIGVDKSAETFSADLNAYFAAQSANGTPVQICGKLLTPETVQLTSQQITALKGVNNVWSNANGNTTVEYFKKG